MRTAFSTLFALTLTLLAASCGRDEFTEPMVLGGVEVPAEVLNNGKDNYTVYCRACHGINGDGNGPAAKGLRPSPRDFRLGLIKYASVGPDYLPPDSDFYRIVKYGLHGTALLEWDISDERLGTIIQYIKTFSDRWQDEWEEVGEPIVASEDPFAGREEEGIELGKKYYHGIAKCWSCHPAYATRDYIYNATLELTGTKITEFRPNLYEPELKESDYGFKILPLDFLYHPIRAGTEEEDLFRSIAAGIGGTAMPMWYGLIPDENIWGIVHYVKYLSDLRDTNEGRRLMSDLVSRAESAPSAEITGEPSN